MDKFKKIIDNLRQSIDKLFLKKTNMAVMMLSFLGIIFIRVFEEKFLAYSPASSGELLIEYLHNLLFFANTFVLIWLILSLFLQKNPIQIAPIVLWAFFLILLPPLIDMVKTGGDIFWSFYLLNSPAGLWGQFITIFGHLPSGIVYFGSKIVFLVAIFSSALIVYLKTRKIIRAAASALAVYTALFFMGSFPSWITFIYHFWQGKSIMSVSGVTVVQFFGSPRTIFGLETNTLKYAFAYQLNLLFYLGLVMLIATLLFWMNREKFWSIIRNVRPPQVIYHAGLFFVGLGLGFLAYPQNFQLNFFSMLVPLVLLISVCLAWFASVIVNDIYDFEIDVISNPMRPLQKKVFTLEEYSEIGFMFFIFSVLGGLIVGSQFAAVLLIYQIIAWFYSAKPYRLKRFIVIATFFSSLASLNIVFLGFLLFSGVDNLKFFPWRVGFLLLITLTISLAVKDLKDIEGDAKDNVWTVPVLWGEELGRIIIATCIFISFMLSMFFLNEFKLFWWALLFGSLAFLAVTNKKIKPRQVFWWVLGIVFIYTLFLVQIVFVKL